MRRAATASLIALALGCSSQSSQDAAAPAGHPDQWNVSAGFVRDPDGRAVIMHGANLSGEAKSKPYFSYHQLADYQTLRTAWGMNAIRFIVIWAGIEPSEGQYDDAYLDAVAERMEWAKQSGLLVVLDMHQDLYGEGFYGDGAPKWTCDASSYEGFVPVTPWFFNYPNPKVTGCYDHFFQTASIQEHYAEAWRRLAARIGDNPAVIGFDPMNEPYWGSQTLSDFEPQTLMPMYERVAASVRKERPHWLAFLEPSSSRNLGLPTHLPAFTMADAVYAPHSYDASAEQGKGFNQQAHDLLAMKVSNLRTDADALGGALWIGEYGCQTDTPGVTPYMDAEYVGAGRVSASAMYWDYGKGGGYSMLNADGSEKAELLSVIVRPYPERVAGQPLTYAFDAATSTFTFEYVPDPSVTAPTIVSVPERVYPSGYQVECGGCAYSKSAGTLTITAPPAGEKATVALRP